MVRPHRELGIGEAIIARGSTEEEYFLPGGANALANGFREKFPQPGSTGEDVLIGGEFRAIGEWQSVPFALFEVARQDSQLLVLAALRQKSVQHRLARNARSQITALGFVDSPMHGFEIDLRPASRKFLGGQLLIGNSGVAKRRQ